MATQVQFRGGTTTEHASFNGAAREVTVDTTKQTLVVQDGTTNGGFPLLREKNPDNVKVQFGGNGTTDAGDLQIYHDSSNDGSYIKEGGAGNLYIFSQNLRIENADGSKSYIEANNEGAVELFWDGSPALATTSTGAKIVSSGSSHGLTIYKGSYEAAFLGHIGSGDEGVLSLKNGGITTILLNGETATATLTGPEGLSASLYLIADEGDDNGDGWRINSNQDANDLTFANNLNSNYLDKFTLTNTGDGTFTGAVKAEGVAIGTSSPVGDIETRNGTRANIIIAKTGLTVKQNSDLHTSYDVIQLGAGGLLASYNAAAVTADTHLVHNAYRGDGGSWEYRYSDTAMRYRMNSPASTFIWDTAASGTAGNSVSFSEVMKLDSAGDLTISDGNLKVADGHGIDFSASESTNVTTDGSILDDYEEGTFSVGFWASNANFTTAPTITVNQCKYTKVGRKVSCSGHVAWSNNGAGAGGNIYMSGLPFNQGANSVYSAAYFGWVSLHSSALTDDEILSGYVNNGQTYLVFLAQADTGYSAVTADELINGRSGDIQFNCTYFTA